MDDQQYQQMPTGSVARKIHVGPLFIGLVIGLIIGTAFGISAPCATTVNPTQPVVTNTVNEEVLRARLKERGLIPSPESIPQLNDTISGTVTGISGSSFTLNVVPFDVFMPDQVYTVTVSGDTTYNIQKMKDFETIQAEMDAFNDQLRKVVGPSDVIAPPSSFSDMPATFSDLAVGDRVTVVATEKITTSPFIAKQVLIPEPLPQPATPEMMQIPPDLSQPTLPEAPAN